MAFVSADSSLRKTEHCAIRSTTSFQRESLSDEVFGVLALSTDNVQREVRWHWNPKFLRKEKGLGKHDAADIRVLLRTYGYAAILRNSFATLFERTHTISYSESFPGQAQRKRNNFAKKPPPAMKLQGE
jgi:hypothetical protein